MDNKIKHLIEWIETTTKEYEEYLESDEFDELEKHDLRVALETLDDVMNIIKHL